MKLRPFTLALRAAPGAPWLTRCRTEDQQPGIDARALRGALRWAYERLIRATGTPERPTPVCRGGDGVDPATSDPSVSAGPCALQNGRPCEACALFGTRDGGAPVLVLGMARLKGDALIAEGRLLDTDNGRLSKRLQAAASLCTWVGAYGPIEAQLNWANAEVEATALDETVHLSLRLLTPAAFPGAARPGVQRTADALPGSALRGAIATALHEADASEAPGVPQLLETAHFDWAWPSAHLPHAWPGPWPITARICSQDPSHAAHDVLFDRLAVRLAQSAGAQWGVEGRLARLDLCPVCRSPMAPRSGSRGQVGPPPRHIIQRGRTPVEVLDAGLKLRCSVRGVPPSARARLARVLTEPLSFGRGRAQGWGRAELRVLPPPARSTVAQRAQAFREGLRAHLRTASLLAQADEAVASVVALTALAPLLPTEHEAHWALPGEAPWSQRYDGSQDLVDALTKRGVTVVQRTLEARRFSLQAGFSRAGRRPTWRQVEAGAVYLLTVAPHQDALLFEALEALEAEGVGLRREQGFGRVLAFDPDLYSAAPDPQGDPMPYQTDPQEAALVGAAQAAVAAQFAGEHGPRALTAVALQRLAAVVREARCHEAVAHWLRAQVGQGWSPKLIGAVVGGLEAAAGFEQADEAAQIAAWRAYSEFLSQAYTWQAAVEGAQ